MGARWKVEKPSSPTPEKTKEGKKTLFAHNEIEKGFAVSVKRGLKRQTGRVVNYISRLPPRTTLPFSVIWFPATINLQNSVGGDHICIFNGALIFFAWVGTLVVALMYIGEETSRARILKNHFPASRYLY